MYEERNIPKAMFRFACLLVIVTFSIGMFKMVHSDVVGRENMSSGYVTDKEIIYRSATYFRDSTTDYILYFEGEYTNDFNNQVAYTKKIYVSEDTYKHYDVGDYFDSKNLIETDERPAIKSQALF